MKLVTVSWLEALPASIAERHLGRQVEVADGVFLSALLAEADQDIVELALEFFLGEIRNTNTRLASVAKRS